jgi:chromosome segregation ATPase
MGVREPYFIRCKSCAAEGGWAKIEGNAVRLWNMRENADLRRRLRETEQARDEATAVLRECRRALEYEKDQYNQFFQYFREIYLLYDVLRSDADALAAELAETEAGIQELNQATEQIQEERDQFLEELEAERERAEGYEAILRIIKDNRRCKADCREYAKRALKGGEDL